MPQAFLPSSAHSNLSLHWPGQLQTYTVNNRDELTLKYFDESTVIVVDNTVGAAFSSWFDDDVESIVRLSGALRESTVNIYSVDQSFRIDVTGKYIEGTMVRVIRQTERSEEPFLYIRNAGFALPKELRRKKLGVRSVAIELFEAARTKQFHAVEVDAIGDYHSLSPGNPASEYSGYSVWPQLGFDGPVPKEAVARFPELSEFKSVRAVIEAENGLDTWLKKGCSALLRFELTAGNPSWVALGRYMLDNGIEVRK